MLPKLERLDSLALVESVVNGARFDNEAGPLEATLFALGIVRLKLGVDAPPTWSC